MKNWQIKCYRKFEFVCKKKKGNGKENKGNDFRKMNVTRIVLEKEIVLSDLGIIRKWSVVFHDKGTTLLSLYSVVLGLPLILLLGYLTNSKDRTIR